MSNSDPVLVEWWGYPGGARWPRFINITPIDTTASFIAQQALEHAELRWARVVSRWAAKVAARAVIARGEHEA